MKGKQKSKQKPASNTTYLLFLLTYQSVGIVRSQHKNINGRSVVGNTYSTLGSVFCVVVGDDC